MKHRICANYQLVGNRTCLFAITIHSKLSLFEWFKRNDLESYLQFITTNETLIQYYNAPKDGPGLEITGSSDISWFSHKIVFIDDFKNIKYLCIGRYYLINNIIFEIKSRPPYSPDTNPSDLILLPKHKGERIFFNRKHTFQTTFVYDKIVR